MARSAGALLFALALLSACGTSAPPQRAQEPAAAAGERDLADLVRAAMRLQAQTDKQRFAAYEEEWRQKVERVGSDHYPEEARGRVHGNLRLTVAIQADGTVKSVTLDRSSGHEVLDRAAFQIISLASPFPPFPPDIRRDTDLLVITRTWFFGRQVEARPSQ